MSAAPTSVTTKWHYQGRKLVRLEHPTQSDTYAYDARGLKTSRTVIIPKTGSSPNTTNTATTSQTLTATTGYEYNEAGQLTATRLPDGSRIQYERNGQGQVVSLSRNPIQTHWLRWAVADQSLAKDFQRDLAGLSSYTAGNGITSQWQRSPAGDLARIVHRAPTSRQTITDRKSVV